MDGERNGSIIPLRQEVVKDNPHVLQEVGSYLAAGLIDFINDMNKCHQPGLGVSFFHQFFDQFDGSEDHPLAGTGNMGEQAMFNGVPLGAIRRIMGDADFDPDLISQGLEIGFEDVMLGTITAHRDYAE